jgi:dUTP pyrophosphatase
MSYYNLNLKINNQFIINHYSNFKYSNVGDSGIDLLNINTLLFKSFETKIINFGFSAEMINIENNKYSNFIIMPRSSLSKTNFQMINSIKIINVGDINEISIGIINTSYEESILEENKCYFQIVSPSLKPIQINIVDNIYENKIFHNSKLLLNIIINMFMMWI